MNKEIFIKQHGTKTLGLLVARFIEHAEPFPGDIALAKEIGIIISDLEWLLEHK